MTTDDPLEFFREKIRSGEPIAHHVFEPPLKVGLVAGGLGVQIDAPFWLAGIEDAGIQRLTLVVSAKTLRDVLAYLENNPDAGPLELKRTQSAN